MDRDSKLIHLPPEEGWELNSSWPLRWNCGWKACLQGMRGIVRDLGVGLFMVSIPYFSSLPFQQSVYVFLLLFVYFFLPCLSLWMRNILWVLMNSLASFEKRPLAGKEEGGKGMYKLSTFLCCAMLWACCGREGNCVLLSCQRSHGKGLSVHKSKKELSVWRNIMTRLPLPFPSLSHNRIWPHGPVNKPSRVYMDTFKNSLDSSVK